jgi:gamma-glutamyl:cysteine ligase YbdK (ATP-grasp superfamily)
LGLRVDKSEFEESEFVRFEEVLAEQLTALKELLARPGFGQGPQSLGAELEMTLIDAEGRPKPEVERVLSRLDSGRFTVELDRFNVECNCAPLALKDGSLTGLERELRRAVAEASSAASHADAEVALIGILPTLTRADLGSAAMTESARYRALSAGLRRQRREAFHVRVDGEDPLDLEWDDVTLEGANTSLQVHLRVAPPDFARVHAAIQLATGPALACSGNSPTLLGHRLWDETRIALFKQAVDARTQQDPLPRVARVSFGTGWVDDAHELFADSVRLHGALLPVLSNEDALSVTRGGGTPQLGELRLHHGTVWRWNRAVYDPAGGGHVRIEMRALPSGPTVVDMVANTAFLLGLALDLSTDADTWRPEVPFAAAEANFYRAAQQGPAAQLVWPQTGGGTARHEAASLAAGLCDRARRGLRTAGVDDADAARYLGVFRERAERGATGAQWQRRRLRELGHRHGDAESLRRMFLDYVAHSRSGAPVHAWRSTG